MGYAQRSQWARRLAPAIAAGAAWLLAAGECHARVKLITLPVRERVEIQLDHPDVTLVEEERIVPLVKGENQVDFSWANTQIDPNSIVFRVVGPAAGATLDVRVLSVSYPPGEPALVWAVAASDSGSARVRISYLLGNLAKSFNYRAVAANDERSLELAQYLRLKNLANEQYDDTQLWAGYGDVLAKPIGLNETREMLVAKHQDVPITKTYSCNPHEFDYLDRPQNKLRVPMHYVLKNDGANNLGGGPLPYGKVRIFIAGAGERAAEDTAFLGEDWGQFTPQDDEMRLYLGVAQDIVVKRVISKNESRRVTGNLFDHETALTYEIENFKKTPVTLDLAENLRYLRNEVRGDTGRDVEWQLGPETTLPGEPDPQRSDSETVLFHVPLPAASADGKAEKVVHKLHIILKHEW